MTDNDAIDRLATKISATGLTIADSMGIAMLAHECALAHEADLPRVALLLAAAADLLSRQHLMLQQANLVPRVEILATGSTH